MNQRQHADRKDRGQDKKTRLDPAVGAEIGTQLRARYQSILREPIPPRFLDLLRAVDSVAPEDGDKPGP